MYPHRGRRTARARILGVSLLLPALLAPRPTAAGIEAYPTAIGITGYLDFYGNPINSAPPGSPVIILSSPTE